MDSDEEEDEIEETKGPKFPIQMYISEANKYFTLGKYDLAIEFFNTALERDPNNNRSLIGRSKCYMRLAKYDEAKEDAEKVLQTYPKSSDAKTLIGEADYFLGDFEKSFLTYYRGHAMRSNNQGLKWGHQMCRKAIENSLNPDMPITIKDEDVQGISTLKEVLDGERPPTYKIGKNQYTSHVDFLNTLLEDDTVETVHPDCEFVKEYLNNRQIFWRTQNPRTSTHTDGSISGRNKENGEDEVHFDESQKVTVEVSPKSGATDKMKDSTKEEDDQEQDPKSSDHDQEGTKVTEQENASNNLADNNKIEGDEDTNTEEPTAEI